MNRSGWGVAASIYNWIAGVIGILVGLYIVLVSGFFLDLLRRSLPDMSVVAILPIIVGVFYLLFGVLRCVAGFGLITIRGWSRITAVVIHIIFGLWNLALAVLLIRADLIGLSLIFVTLFIANVVMSVGLLLRSTADAYAGYSMGVSRQTQIAPVINYNYQAPTQAAPTPIQAAPVANTTGTYAQPRPVGVARTEVAGQKGPQIVAWLVERNGPRAGKEHRLDNQITVGRDPGRCEIVLDEGKISSEHARIRFEQGRYVLFDLASTNHTYVNNQEIQKHVLQDGDQVRLGPNVQMTFVQAGRP